MVSEDRTAAFAAIPVTSTSATDNIDKVEDLREQLRDDAPDGLDVQVTGPAGIQADLGKVFDGANFRLLLSTAGVVALLLIITYRSPVLWLVPLIVVGIADRLSAIVATNVLQVTGVAWDESTVGILSVAGLRRRHRLRPAPHLALPRRARSRRSRATSPWRAPSPAPPRRSPRARSPWCSAC